MTGTQADRRDAKGQSQQAETGGSMQYANNTSGAVRASVRFHAVAAGRAP